MNESRSSPNRDGAEVVSIEVTYTSRVPHSDELRVDHERYDLEQGQVPPDLRPYQRRPPGDPVSSAETMEILPVDTSPNGIDVRSGSLDETSDLRLEPAGQGTVVQGSPVPHAVGDEERIPVLPPGTCLGHFEIQSDLGQGGMGVVYKAYDRTLDRHVALKVLAPALSRNKSFIERFRREAMACGKLSHPNITHIYSISSENERFHYFAMEYVEGQNLSECVRKEGPLGWQRVLEIGAQAAAGLKEAAAAKIIHRDIKPSNLLLAGGGRIKITDFGLAKARASIGHTLDLTSTGVVMGTPLYMSPEQGRGGLVDHRSDMYALGGTMYFLAYGRPPFEADTPIALILKHINEPLVFPDEPETPAGFRALLHKMMEKDISRRPATYDDLLARIAQAARGEAPEEESGRRVIVLSRASRRTGRKGKAGKSGIFSTDGLKATKLSVARTNLKLGRRDKAVSLLLETIREGDPSLRSEAALLLLTLYEQEGDVSGMRRMAETVLGQSDDPAAQAYAAWRLASLDEAEAIQRKQAALERYRAILKTPPAGLPRELIEEQVRRLQAQIAEAEKDHGNTQIVLGNQPR